MPRLARLALVVLLLLLAAAVGRGQDVQDETLDGVRPPGYVTIAPAGELTGVALVLGDVDADPAALARAVAPHVSSGTRIVAPRLTLLDGERADRGFHRFAGDDDRDRDADLAIARKLIGATLADARRKHRLDAVPVSVIGMFDGAALAVQLAQSDDAVRYLLLVQPAADDLPAVTAGADDRWPAVDVFVNARTRTAADAAIDAVRGKLGDWSATGRFYAGSLRAPGLPGLLAEAFGCVKGRKLYRATGEEVSLDAMVATLAQHDVIFGGEHHGNPVAHRTQLDIFRALLDRHPKTALAMEQFERDAQPWIDRYLKGEIEEAEFLANSRPWPNYRDYRPMIELAKERGVPVIAGNIPRRLAARINRGENPASDFTDEERSWTAREIVVLEDSYLQKFHEAFGDPDRKQDLSSMYRSQCAKDDTMAEAMHDFLQANAGWRVFHTNGSFHSDYHLGAAQKLARINSRLKITVVSPVASDNPPRERWDAEWAEQGDFLMVIPAPRPQRPRRMPNPHAEEPKPANPHETPDDDANAGTHEHQAPAATPDGEHTTSAVATWKLDVALHPKTNSLTCTATATLPRELADTFAIREMMHGMRIYRIPYWMQPEIKVTEVSAASGDLTARSARTVPDVDSHETGSRALIVAFMGDPPAGEAIRVTVTYEGTIHDPVERDSSLTGDSGDRTSGIIGNEGVYLAGGGGWYPMLKDQRLANFHVRASVDAPFHVVTQGKLLARDEADGANRSTWQAELPTPGLTLVAGPYVFATKKTDSGVSVTSAFFESEAELGAMFLSYAVSVISTYEEYLGDFPFSSFHIVENFFASGYGMPGYTLLGKGLVSMGPMAFMPGMLDHEIVHSWWGCSVYTDHSRGNWCEAFTSYYTNYGAHELSGPDKAVRKMRDLVLAYNNDVAPGAGIPLKDFSWRANRVLGAVGYSKGLIFLHHLRGVVGDDAFFASMKQLAGAFRGRYMSWTDIRAAFTSEHFDLDAIFAQWLDRPDIPDLEIVNAHFEPKTGEVVFTIRQLTDEPWNLPGLRLSVESGENRTQTRVTLTEAERTFRIGGHARGPVRIRLANHDGTPLLRQLQTNEIPANMGLVSGAEKLVLVLPAEGDHFAAIARGLQREGVTVLRGNEATPETLAGSAVLMLGTPDTNPAFALLDGRQLADTLTARNGVLHHGDQPLQGDDLDVLAAFDNPFAPGRPMAVYQPYSEVGVGRARVIFRYRWDSLVVFRNGRPETRLGFDAPVNRLRVTINTDGD